MNKKLKQYFKNIIIWLDQGINVFLFAGHPDETLSSKAAKWADEGYVWPERVIDFLFGEGHCQACREDDREDNIGVDRGKQLHFICGFFICLGFGLLLYPEKGLAAAFFAAIVKALFNLVENAADGDTWLPLAVLSGGFAGYLILLGVGI